MTMSPIGLDHLRAVGAQAVADLGDLVALDQESAPAISPSGRPG